MATRQSTSKSRRARNPRPPGPAPEPLRSAIEALVSTEVALIDDPLERAIERERCRLTYADSILECVLAALRFGENGEPGVSCSNAPAVSLARTMLQESVNRLDSVYIEPLRGPKAATSPARSEFRKRGRRA